MNAFYHLLTSSATSPVLCSVRFRYGLKNFFNEWIMEIDFGIFFRFGFVYLWYIFIKAPTKVNSILQARTLTISLHHWHRRHENMENVLYRNCFIYNHQYKWSSKKNNVVLENIKKRKNVSIFARNVKNVPTPFWTYCTTLKLWITITSVIDPI